MTRVGATTGRPPEVLCLGESMAALLPGTPGPVKTVDTFHLAFGGAESGVACALAGLGVPSAWISRVSDDGLGRRLRSEIASRGVDVSAVATDRLRHTGLYVKETGAAGRPHSYRSGSAASALGPELLDDPAFRRLLRRARVLHLSGITPGLSDSCLALVRTLLTVRRPDLLISFDLNWHPALWSHRDPAVLPELLDRADLLLLGADEAAAAFGTGDPAELRRLFPSPGTVVVTDADHHVTALDRDGTAVTEQAPHVETVEPAGLGEGFVAGYLAATLRGLDQRARLRLGHLAAREMVGRPAAAPVRMSG
ncbi:sugar kinase [Kitasatospora cinereorecta]|uniref:Sugar kinase n=1 Tax=Kitasatospora cinereorecta TaxID=285560 RepID=A0ABW0V4J5_9ACTN